MEVTGTALPGVLLIRPRVFRDERGHFLETWRRGRYAEAGVPTEFVQDNAALSNRGVVRGLHYQYPEPQGKLVTVLAGEVFDVVVDIRRGSETFGEWYGVRLSAASGHQLWIPEGYAHGYAALAEGTVFAYKCTRSYNAEAEAAIRYDDPDIGIEWPVARPIVSAKDREAPRLSEIPPEGLPTLGELDR